MITLIEALNYRCLRYIRQPLGPLHVLVGANASGKSTFLDVIGFLHDLVTKGLDEAVASRSANFYDLVWQQEGDKFELAVEVAIPESLRESVEDTTHTTVRYEVAIRLEKDTNRLELVAEQARFKAPSELESNSRDVPPRTLLEQNVIAENGSLRPSLLFAKCRDSEGRFFFRGIGRTTRSTREMNVGLLAPVLLGSLFDGHPFNYPVSLSLHEMLSGVKKMQLGPSGLANSSRPGQGAWIGLDGSNLPWVVARFEQQSPERFREWIEHLQTALPDLTGVTTIERPEDRHRYLSLEYRGGLKVPSWMVSDGTLRLLALTLPAYLPDFDGTLLVEEPENGLHPLAIETVYQSLSSVYDGQVLLATHSPMMVAVAKPSEVLCFSRDDHGAARIVSGDRHPELSDWHGEVDLGTLFASGMLG